MDILLKAEKLFFSGIGIKNKHNKLGYKKYFEDSKVILYKRPVLNRKILSTFETLAVAQNIMNPNVLYLYPNINSKVCKKIKLNNKNFPGLIQNSKVQQCMFIPYMRDLGDGRIVKAVRLNVITDKCQVFHNYPARNRNNEGISVFGDDIRFEESAAWDVPNHLYPSKDKECSEVERYFPHLPDDAYKYYPLLNTDSEFIDRYNNGGFDKKHKVIVAGKEVWVSRFYFPKRKAECNSFYHIGGEEPTYKMTVIGTYRANNNGNGVRTVIMASSDGGRNWFAKYEFGDMGEYEFTQGIADWRKAFGNNIIIENDIYDKNIFVRKRNVKVPSGADKEPKTAFLWGEKVEIESIKCGDTAIVTTNSHHGLTTGNIVAIICKSKKDLGVLFNNDINSETCGNGILYKVNVIDETTFEIYEYVAASDNPICCRHIHQINRIKDGWLIGTGEIYPNGWLLYMQMKEADLYSFKFANDEFAIFRLNSDKNSVQRTLGAILLDDEDQTLIFASDHDVLSRSAVTIFERNNINFERNSIGIFKGRLVDIDNRNKFKIIYEAQEPSFFFKKIKGNLVFAGQIGEFAISFDMGERWNTYSLNTDTFMYFGTNYWYTVLGDYIIQFK